MVKSDSIEEGIKALYAVSALIRNNLASQELFYAEAGGLMLQVTYLSFNIIVNIVIFFNYFSALVNGN
jgi:hypothetical protein